jgi:hypothetical protein
LHWWEIPLASASKLGPLENELLRVLLKRDQATSIMRTTDDDPD